MKTAADVVAVEFTERGCRGRGEGVPYPRYGETTNSVMAQIRDVTRQLEQGLSRADLCRALPPGAARNAIDCALWDLEAQLTGRSVSELLGESAPPPVVSALTVSLGTPQEMGAAAAELRGASLIKVKVDRESATACLEAVRAAAPDARLIVDPNESWTFQTLVDMQPRLHDLRVDLLEQPLPADEDEALQGFDSCVPICADEALHVGGDLPALAGRYQYVNIKLDKTGGLTEALRLLAAAREMKFGVMVGCMVSTSMSIAPAFHVARHADFVDLDGPTWIARDYPGGAVQRAANLHPPAAHLWGAPSHNTT